MKDNTNVEREASIFLNEARNLIGYCQTHCYATRDQAVQKTCQGLLQKAAATCLNLKRNAIEAGMEDVANALLSIEFSMRAVFNALSMWITLKEDLLVNVQFREVNLFQIVPGSGWEAALELF